MVDAVFQQSYEVPIAMKAVFDYIDTFSSRIREMEQQKRDGVACKKEDKPRSLENFLSRWDSKSSCVHKYYTSGKVFCRYLPPFTHTHTAQRCRAGLRSKLFHTKLRKPSLHGFVMFDDFLKELPQSCSH